MTHLIRIQDGATWANQNTCSRCGTRVQFAGDWTATSLLATCEQAPEIVEVTTSDLINVLRYLADSGR